ncbi:hypothetical protein [Actinophytocola sp.]|uniref:hypothetical protein n=1 Tax=Actinophytocola sp. TaxID=1872138 RepID=UPI002ED3305F
MNDLEDRLRATLREAADTLPPTPGARAEFERRRGRGRGVLLAAAAAAVVIAGVAVPVALSGNDAPAGHRAATGTTSPRFEENNAKDSVNILGTFTEDGITKVAVLTVVDDKWCVLEALPKEPIPMSRDCEPVPTWPVPEPPTSQGGRVVTEAVLSGGTLYGGPLPNLMLFITAPEVETLEVSAGSGGLVHLRKVLERPDATFILADFPETYAGFGYTAKDAAGNVLESAIT